MMEVLIGSFVVILILSILYFMSLEETSTASHMSLMDAKHALRSGNIRSVVDVRKEYQYQSGHYPDAISFPLSIMNEQTITRKEISEKMYTPTLVYCNSGRQARIAAQKLTKQGIYPVYYVSVPYWKLME